jgi:phosphatidylserine/phosphatidylglycerophosphate/cardiolipin synthase-like enzyme
LGFALCPLDNPGPVGAVSLEERLLAAAHRGVAVHLVLNHVTPMVSPANTCLPVEHYFARRDTRRLVGIRRLRTPQTLPIHSKLLVIDDRIAYLMGSPFLQEYFDGRAHHIDEPRRGHVRWRRQVGTAVHDVSARLEGPVVADLDAAFRLHWEHARPSPGSGPSADRIPPFRPPSPNGQPGRATVQVTRTLPGSNRYTGFPTGETGVMEAYLRALANARRFIYLENQYLTSLEMADALVHAVASNPELELIALINTRPAIPYYPRWQRAALERLLTGLHENNAQTRAGIYTLWSHENGVEGTRILRTYVHSKLAIIDDDWLTIGSANLDSLSLSHSQHELHRLPLITLARFVGGASAGDPWEARSTEINVTFAGPEATADITRLRRDLWAEHLGFASAGDTALAAAPTGGWLELWRRRAQLKLDGLRAHPPVVQDPRILPYPHQDDRLPDQSHRTAGYLRALGVDPNLLQVHGGFRSFSFRRGRWRREVLPTTAAVRGRPNRFDRSNQIDV